MRCPLYYHPLASVDVTHRLSLIGDAKRLCPEIILRSGEDLTHYRQHSRRIWRLVNGLIGSSPEKLGMDELFIDATPLIDAHLANEAEREARYFRLGNPDEAFTYEGDLAGFPYGRAEDEMSEANIRLAIASHLADYVRKRILHDEGFSTSAGVAPNKLLAKLLASENKPAKQTTWLPPADAEARRQAVQNYLGPLPLNKCALLSLMVRSSTHTNAQTQWLRSSLHHDATTEAARRARASGQRLDGCSPKYGHRR